MVRQEQRTDKACVCDCYSGPWKHILKLVVVEDLHDELRANHVTSGKGRQIRALARAQSVPYPVLLHIPRLRGASAIASSKRGAAARLGESAQGRDSDAQAEHRTSHDTNDAHV